MNEQSHYKQDKTITRQSINVKRHIFNVIGDTKKFEERDLNIGGDDVGNVSVWVQLHGVPITTFSEDGLSAIATKISTPLMLDSYTSDMCLQSWDRSSYARTMIELRADVELKDTIVVAMPKLTREGFYTCIVRVEYEWKPPRCACCKVFGHIQEECPKNPGLGVAKNLRKPSQAPRGVPVGLKVGFKPVKQAYRPVSTKPTTNTSGNKKNDVEPTKKVSNSNPFDMLNSVENDVNLGTNGGTSNLVSKEPNSSGSSFWNVESSSTSTTPIVDKIGKFEKLIIDGKVTLVDDEGEPVKNVDYLGDHDSENEVASVDNDMARSIASEKVGFGTNSFLKQWRDTYENDDYDYDPYDDDMYEG
ncbi:retrotransposon protein, putative, ty1-copia subclass [Tanacetum coccineum]